MKTFVIVSEKRWNRKLFQELKHSHPNEKWVYISNKDDFNLSNLHNISPAIIFVPHWSYIIPEKIYKTYECIVFHMTDLPFGRGGSPLQNLLVKGIRNTKISALKVSEGLDTGDIYLKKDLFLYGTAEEIFIRANAVIKEMISEIITKRLQPKPQTGTPVLFKRRKAEDGNIEKLESLSNVYDYIQMLDADGYPKAFLEKGNFKFEFSRASLKADESIVADVRITQIKK